MDASEKDVDDIVPSERSDSIHHETEKRDDRPAGSGYSGIEEAVSDAEWNSYRESLPDAEEWDDFAAAVGFSQETGEWDNRPLDAAWHEALKGSVTQRAKQVREPLERKRRSDGLTFEEYHKQSVTTSFRKLLDAQEKDKASGRFDVTLNHFLANSNTALGVSCQVQSQSDWETIESHEVESLHNMPTPGMVHVYKNGTKRKILYVIVEERRLRVLTE